MRIVLKAEVATTFLVDIEAVSEAAALYRIQCDARRDGRIYQWLSPERVVDSGISVDVLDEHDRLVYADDIASLFGDGSP